ncbi:MAG: trigger factor [Alphaproteobacteria bacterium]|nr:MAG: trigger factor [Alphaproteobacteria bacterium]
MQVTETLAEGLKREFTILVPAADIAAQVDERLTALGTTVKVPGFRPGKVPMTMLRQRYGRSVMGEVLEQVVETSSAKALEERGLRPAMMPKIKVTQFDEGADLEYSMSLEVIPEITPVDFATLELERPVADVTDKEIEDALDRLKQRYKRFEPITEARPAANGDSVLIDFEGKIDGVPFEGGKGEGYGLELGSNTFIPGFEEQLLGINAGETRDIKVAFPADYPSAEVAGKDAVFTVTATEIRTAVEQVVDDAFATSVGAESAEKLREAVRGEIEREFANASRMRLKRALLDKLAETHDFEVPAGMVEAEFEGIWKRVEEARGRGVTDPDMEGKSDDEQKTEYRAIATRRVRLGLLLAEVGRINQIRVSEDELRRAAIREATRYPGQERAVIEYFQKNRDAMESLKAPVLEEKVVDFILDIAKLTDKSMTPAELFEEPAAD